MQSKVKDYRPATTGWLYKVWLALEGGKSEKRDGGRSVCLGFYDAYTEFFLGVRFVGRAGMERWG